jgi:hypothetical protein
LTLNKISNSRKIASLPGIDFDVEVGAYINVAVFIYGRFGRYKYQNYGVGVDYLFMVMILESNFQLVECMIRIAAHFQYHESYQHNFLVTVGDDHKHLNEVQ